MKKAVSVILTVVGIAFASLGITLRTKETSAISIIGKADGPTSVFLAGRIGNGFNIVIILGIILVLIGAGTFFIKKR